MEKYYVNRDKEMYRKLNNPLRSEATKVRGVWPMEKCAMLVKVGRLEMYRMVKGIVFHN